ncbi:hypothetical protein BD779DRAFT_1582781 [Infundibulicybe gibba]|nr:hypothetical protein BD779DRAFT_1582781 [Infundibulicybe gibba]
MVTSQKSSLTITAMHWIFRLTDLEMHHLPNNLPVRLLPALRHSTQKSRRSRMLPKSSVAAVPAKNRPCVMLHMLSTDPRLPSEILSQIFILHAQLEQQWLKSVLTVIHVCKRWWQIGLSCPRLWSHIDFEDCHSAAGMAAMFERSCSVPLSLSVSDRADMGSRGIALVVNNMHRVKLFDMSVWGENADSFFETFNKPVPLLQHLNISYHGCETFAFPSEFLSGSAPNLRHIELTTGAYVPWTSGLFANLITLEINGSWCNGPDPPSLEMLLSALAKMPALEILYLGSCLPQTTSTTAAHVDLPNFRELVVRSPLRDATCFLKQITIDANAIVDLHLGYPYISDVKDFFTIFPSHLSTAASPTVRALKFTWIRSSRFRVGVWTTQPDAQTTSFQHKITLNFNWDPPYRRNVIPPDLPWICFTALASSQLSAFRISDVNIQWDVEVWRKVARVCPDLRKLAPGSITQCIELCRALRPPDKQDLVLADCCFPALSYLELEIPYKHPMQTPDGEIAPFPEVLAQTLSARAIIGCSTPELAFVWPESF